jgi:opacity protein-like surface antigen
MGKYEAVLVVLTVVLAAAPAYATDRYYAVSAGAYMPRATPEAAYDTGLRVGAEAGAAFVNGLRLESQVVYHQASAKAPADGRLWNAGLLINAWGDIRNKTPFTPYAGGGFGFGRGKVSSSGPVPIDNSGYGIAWQLGAGVDCKIAAQWSVDLGWRYYKIWDVSSSGGNGSFNPAGSSLQGGVKMWF